MDELAVLTHHRPDAPPPTADERSIARAALMAHIDVADGTPIADAEPLADAAPIGPVVDITAPPRRNRRTIRRAAVLAGVAAAVTAGIVVGGGGGRAPEPLRDRPASAAEQLRAIADVVAPYPAMPYAVTTQLKDTVTGEGEPRSETATVVVHRTSPEVWITEVPDCPDPCARFVGGGEDPPFAPDATAEEVRAGIDAEVRRRWAGPDGALPDDMTPEHLAQFRVYLLGSLLRHPLPGPAARAEMMRMLAEVPGLTATPDQRSADGTVGTLFRFVDERGEEISLLLDPADGYVLEASAEMRADRPLRLPSDPFTGNEDDPATVLGDETRPEGPLLYSHRSQRTYARPTTGPVPEAVATLAAALADAGSELDMGSGTGSACIGGRGPSLADHGSPIPVAVPAGLMFTYCPAG